MRVTILSADYYDVTDKDSGKHITGWSLWIVDEGARANTADSFGVKPAKLSVLPDVAAPLRAHKLPAEFDVDVALRSGAAGKAAVTVVAISPIKLAK